MLGNCRGVAPSYASGPAESRGSRSVQQARRRCVGVGMCATVSSLHVCRAAHLLGRMCPFTVDQPACTITNTVTSGCLVVAKSVQALERLRNSLRTAEMRKFYVALAVGKFQVQEGSFDLYFSGRYRRSKKVSVAVTGRAQDMGSCRWHVLGRDAFLLSSLWPAHEDPARQVWKSQDASCT